MTRDLKSQSILLRKWLADKTQRFPPKSGSAHGDRARPPSTSITDAEPQIQRLEYSIPPLACALLLLVRHKNPDGDISETKTTPIDKAAPGIVCRQERLNFDDYDGFGCSQDVIENVLNILYFHIFAYFGLLPSFPRTSFFLTFSFDFFIYGFHPK